MIRDCIAVPVIDDGLSFDLRSVRGEDIRVNTRYLGVRIRLLGLLDSARIPLQVDIGYGDAVLPPPGRIEYPSLLHFAPPKLLGYAPETTIAEKFHAMVELEAANSRLKDFYDIWFLARSRQFEGTTLAGALHATFMRRGTPLPDQVPYALTPAFYDASEKQAQWRAFLRKLGLQQPELLGSAAATIKQLLIPVVSGLRSGAPLTGTWIPPGPWT